MVAVLLDPRSRLYLAVLLSCMLLIVACGDDKNSDPDLGDTDVLDVVDITPDIPLGAEPCTPCTHPDDCGGPDDFCILLGPAEGGEQVCSRSCEVSECPSGYDCVQILPDIRQCVPVSGSCLDPCEAANCGDSEVCVQGDCLPALELCDLDCLDDAQCGADGDRCVQIPASGESICALDCAEDPALCPDGYVCGTAGESRQCVPANLTCIERCADVTCPDGQVCDPFSGDCRLPMGQCDQDCVLSALCGQSDQDRCVLLAASDEVVCALDCLTDPTVCPAGTYCNAAEDGTTANCIPSTNTCRTDRCDGVSCGSGQQCDPVSGTCVQTKVLCEGPCTNNNACLGSEDICLSFEAGSSFCAQSCTETARCSLGYGCLLITNGKRYCIPVSQSCDFAGIPCTYENRFADCAGTDVVCSATRPGDDGVCLPSCSDASCPAGLPVCAGLHLQGELCLVQEPFDASTCGRQALEDAPVGRPCGDNLSPLCPAPTDICHVPADGATAPFCTRACASDADCDARSACRPVDGGASVCVPLQCAACLTERTTTGLDLLDIALSATGHTLCDFAITDLHLSVRDASEARLHNLLPRGPMLSRRPVDGIQTARAFGASAEAAVLGSSPARDALVGLMEAAGHVPMFPGSTHTLDPSEPLASAVAALITAGGGTPDVAALALDAADIPLDLQQMLAPVVLSMAEQLPRRDAAFDMPLSTPGVDSVFDAGHGLMLRLDSGMAPPDIQSGVVTDLVRDGAFDLQELGGAAAELLHQIEAAGLVSNPMWGSFTFDQMTPVGRIAIRGNGDDTWTTTDGDTQGDLALTVDAGGNDTYFYPVATNTSLSQPFGLHLDLGGADTYSYVPVADPADTGLLPSDGTGRHVPSQPLSLEDGPVSLSDTPRQGAGRFGIAVLFDVGTDIDTYQSLRRSQGYGLFGVGILVDGGGNDIYSLEAAGQGAGLWGLGMLVDLGGDDDYTAWHLSQGAAGPGGLGGLIDGNGNDDYLAVPGQSNGTEVLYLNLPDRSSSNASVAQGAAVGRGLDGAPDGLLLPGGIGILVDVAGTDTYRAGVYAQGSGGWHGTGMLVDRAGNDFYDARRFAQGAGLRYGAGYLIESSGDDQYNTVIDRPGVALAVSELAAIGVLLEDAGNDQYVVTGVSAGAAVDNGIALFIDTDGADNYIADSAQSLGFAVTDPAGVTAMDPRGTVPTTGLFIDGGGADTYGPMGVIYVGIGNDTFWSNQGDILLSAESGVGIDGSGTVGF